MDCPSDLPSILTRTFRMLPDNQHFSSTFEGEALACCLPSLLSPLSIDVLATGLVMMWPWASTSDSPAFRSAQSLRWSLADSVSRRLCRLVVNLTRNETKRATPSAGLTDCRAYFGTWVFLTCSDQEVFICQFRRRERNEPRHCTGVAPIQPRCTGASSQQQPPEQLRAPEVTRRAGICCFFLFSNGAFLNQAAIDMVAVTITRSAHRVPAFVMAHFRSLALPKLILDATTLKWSPKLGRFSLL